MVENKTSKGKIRFGSSEGKKNKTMDSAQIKDRLGDTVGKSASFTLHL